MVDFGSSVFSELVPASNIDEVRAVFEVNSSDLRDQAEEQLLAAWLNFASGAVGWDEDVDGITAGDRIAQWPHLFPDGERQILLHQLQDLQRQVIQLLERLAGLLQKQVSAAERI
jgi:hypothetical protein